MKKQPTEVYQARREVFLEVRATRDLGSLLKTEVQQLNLLAQKPQYSSFTTPKKDGGKREIEAPVAYLKKIQRRLNAYLQAVYYFERTPAAFGYIISSIRELDCRNIVTNAKKHRGQPHLTNLDLEDFFHSISRRQVAEVFLLPPFNFRLQVAELLAGLTTFEGRLPVGAPTSPVLSNFVCRALDVELQDFAQAEGLVYSRYVDDLSISGPELLSDRQYDIIEGIIAKAGFAINDNKVKRYGPDDDKIVTGLVVGKKKVKLAPGFLEQVRADIDQLADVCRLQNEHGVLATKWVDRYKEQIRGKLSFVSFALGKNNGEYIQLKSDFFSAIAPPVEEFGAASWKAFQYF